jgi:hypothetical protein
MAIEPHASLESVMSAHRPLRALVAAGFLGLLAAGPTAAEPDSLVRDGAESTLRVPLSRDDSRAAARLLPYLSVGSTFPSDDPRSAPTSVYEDLRSPTRRGMDVGAGLSWRLGERVELFGEYRFLRVNPDPTEAIGGGVLRRDVEGPYLKGGFSIKLP